MTLTTIRETIKNAAGPAKELRKQVEQYGHEQKVMTAEELSELKQQILEVENDIAMADSLLWEYWRESPHSNRMVRK